MTPGDISAFAQGAVVTVVLYAMALPKPLIDLASDATAFLY